jgi:hypothetical protein
LLLLLLLLQFATSHAKVAMGRPTFLTASLINRLGSKGSGYRGQSMVGDVEVIEESDESIEASVASSGGYGQYQVSVTWDDEDDSSTLDGECECPDSRGGFCKHVCAVLHYMLQAASETPSSSYSGTALPLSTGSTSPKAATPLWSFGTSTFGATTAPVSVSVSSSAVPSALPWISPAPKSDAPPICSYSDAVSVWVTLC